MRWLFAIVLALLSYSRTAIAHQSSLTYSSVAVSDSGKELEFEIRLSSNDLSEALSLNDDRDATDAEILEGAQDLRRYVFDRVRIRVPDQACARSYGPVSVELDGQRFAQLRETVQCSRPISRVEFVYELFFDLDERHEGLMRADGGLVQFTSEARRYQHVLGNEPPATVLGFFVSGANHVLFGMDHILFLISLMMVMGLCRQGDSLRQRSVRETARNAALVATAFTLGHSITLIVAALGWISLSSRFVESLIAASIVYVAVENVLRPDPPRRYLLTFSFGLVHGMGFASMLRPLLPPADVVVPLLVFNAGVEAGQIVVLLAAIPILGILMHRIGTRRYRRLVLPVSSGVLALAGLVWFVERAFAL